MYPILLVAGETNKTYQYLFLILKKNQHFYFIYHILGSNMNVNNGQILTPLNNYNWIAVYKSYVQQHLRDELG